MTEGCGETGCADIKAVAREAAREAAQEAIKEFNKNFRMMGIDPDSPFEMQEDFAWLRKFRQMSEKVGSRIIITLVITATGGAVAALWSGFKSKIGG